MLKTKNRTIDKTQAIRKTIALLLFFITLIALITELVTYAMFIIPVVLIQLYQYVGLTTAGSDTIERALSFGTSAYMLWGGTTIFFISISVYLHCKLIKRALKKWWTWLKIVFERRKVNG